MGLRLNDQISLLWAAEVLKFSLMLMKLGLHTGALNGVLGTLQSGYLCTHFIVMLNGSGFERHKLAAAEEEHGHNLATDWPQPGHRLATSWHKLAQAGTS